MVFMFGRLNQEDEITVPFSASDFTSLKIVDHIILFAVSMYDSGGILGLRQQDIPYLGPSNISLMLISPVPRASGLACPSPSFHPIIYIVLKVAGMVPSSFP